MERQWTVTCPFCEQQIAGENFHEHAVECIRVNPLEQEALEYLVQHEQRHEVSNA